MRDGGDAPGERPAEERGRRLPGIAEAEVEEALAGRDEGLAALVELDHEVLLDPTEDRALRGVLHGDREE